MSDGTPRGAPRTGPVRSVASAPRRSRRPLRAWPQGFAATREDRAALHLLLRLASLTPDRLLALAQSKPTAGACLGQSQRGVPGAGRPALGHGGCPGCPRGGRARGGARLVAVGDADYPVELFDLYDPPAGLFVRGRALEPDRARVARRRARATLGGRARGGGRLGRGLAEAGACVVSGVARGIDGAAHRGALTAAPVPVGVATLAVLGSGIDTTYPPSKPWSAGEDRRRRHRAERIPAGDARGAFRFPARNRIIAALSRAVVVVEGARGSGSLITAEHALDLGREVFAVPGPVFSDLAARRSS